MKKTRKKIGLMGGTFNPPHKGHLYSALKFYDLLELDEMIIMPDSTPPHKDIPGDDTPRLRYEMCRIQFSEKYVGKRNIHVSDYEISKGGKSYTYETLEHLKDENSEIFLYCGEDMFLTLDLWKCPEKIFSLSTPVCSRREKAEDSEAQVKDKQEEYRKKYGKETLILHYPPLEMSSTEARATIISGSDTEKFLVPEVKEFIRDNLLYDGGEGRLKCLREAIKNIVGRRITHILSTEEEVYEMSKLTSLSQKEVFNLRAAALLHDITHKMSTQDQIALCEENGFSVDGEYLSSPPTLHSQSGCVFVKIHFPEFALDEILSMISCHTVGKERMTLSEKMLCFADYIEKTREYESCRAARKSFWEKVNQDNFEKVLNSSLLEYFINTEKHCLEKGEHVNEIMLRARKSLEEKINQNK